MAEKTRQIETGYLCPLCRSPVVLGVRAKGYSGYVKNKEDIPEGAYLVGERLFGGGTRYYVRFPGFIPHCSNRNCFLYSAKKMFREIEDAENAWVEGTMM